MGSRQMLALSLGGVIGTGIFMSPGYFIQSAGALGTIFGYIVGAILVCLVMQCLGELSVDNPKTGSFHDYANAYINKGVGFVVAWLYWATWTIALGSNLLTIGILMRRWFPSFPIWIWCFCFGLLIFIVNLNQLTWFNKSEALTSWIKTVALMIFVGIGLLMIAKVLPNHDPYQVKGFSQLTNRGWLPNGIGPILATILTANFAYSGAEMIGVAAGEAKNPDKTIPKAMRQTLAILIVLFIGAIFVMGTLLSPQDQGLTTSPFVTILNHAGIPGAADIMNAILIITLFSASNAGVYAASRMIWSLADKGEITRKLAKLNHVGLPVYGLCLTMAGGALSLLSGIYAAQTIYLILNALSAFAVVAVWIVIAWSELNFRRQYLQKHDLSDLKYRVSWYPFTPITVILICLLSIVGIGFDPNQQIALIVGIPVTICLYFYRILVERKKEKSDEL
ncbi:amino acid permease [Convivina intestini]|uniref:S-methylmethionine:proton symporter (AAT family) n=1 Tax=Convivina intestini TaxID=1505726 RepID=A0A2U1D9K8_9LACO|nr:amino acid permease [Convivina intestini]PVY84337.1 S-methylmethionine:proton symporter (AAT family) [Convivina intestini]CAH1857010.1 Amino-acid permease RocE [Convivina intestini]SDC06268.1 S-methylmethionine transporter [Leuconostocaceae bacterium R-53105]